jgi:hypothetical protein
MFVSVSPAPMSGLKLSCPLSSQRRQQLLLLLLHSWHQVVLPRGLLFTQRCWLHKMQPAPPTLSVTLWVQSSKVRTQLQVGCGSTAGGSEWRACEFLQLQLLCALQSRRGLVPCLCVVYLAPSRFCGVQGNSQNAWVFRAGLFCASPCPIKACCALYPHSCLLLIHTHRRWQRCFSDSFLIFLLLHNHRHSSSVRVVACPNDSSLGNKPLLVVTATGRQAGRQACFKQAAQRCCAHYNSNSTACVFVHGLRPWHSWLAPFGVHGIHGIPENHKSLETLLPHSHV